MILTSDPRPQKTLPCLPATDGVKSKLFLVFFVALVQRKALWYDDHMCFLVGSSKAANPFCENLK